MLQTISSKSLRPTSRAVLMWMRSMSCRPEGPEQRTSKDKEPPRPKVTIQKLKQLRESGAPIAMLTAYDYPTGRACESYGVDITLVGDSLAQVCLGYDSTTRLSIDEMVHHCKAVARGSKSPLLVADMPFGSYHVSEEETMRNAVRLVREAGVDAIKMEGGEEILNTVRRVTSFGIPVMAHIGLLPQRHVSLSGYRVQGKNAVAAKQLLKVAQSLQQAGAFSMVLEAMPSRLAEHITKVLSIPTIGIGAGSGTNGQVLVWDDMMGTWNGHKAKFVRRFADVKSEARKGVTEYVKAVRDRSFPDENESYPMEEREWDEFVKSLKE